MSKKIYEIERDGQIDFFNNYGVDWRQDDEILVNNTDGVYNGILFEFKLNIIDLNKTLLQAIKYLSKLRIIGKSVPATILLVSLNDTMIYMYKSQDYFDDIHKVYVGSASKANEGFVSSPYIEKFDYSNIVASNRVKHLLNDKKSVFDMYMPIDIDENCIVGWAERYYREIPTANKGDFLGDENGQAVVVMGEIREPRHFKGLINPYKGQTNEKFKYLMGRLNDRLNRKDLGAFYTPIPYAKKAAELVMMAVERVPVGNDYIILDRCAGTGNLEEALIGLVDKNGSPLISHCVISTYEYYEYKVLNERLGDKVRDIIPPTEADVVYANGKVSNADAMSEDFINNPIIKSYLDDKNCTVILFENPPYTDSSAADNSTGNKKNKVKTKRKDSYVTSEFKKHIKEFNGSQASSRELMNLFAYSGFYMGYLRQPTDSYICFGHVNYYKNIHIYRTFVAGYALNQGFFDANNSVTTVIYWANIPSNNLTFDLPALDIVNNTCVPVVSPDGTPVTINIKQCHKSINELANKYVKDIGVPSNVVCGADGYPIPGYEYKRGRKPIYSDEIIAYCRTTNLKLDAMNYALVRTNLNTGLEQCYGRYLFKSNYLGQLPLFAAKLFYEDKWWERDVYSTTSDGGNVYLKDKEFIKSCLIFTCLSNQNKCLSFDGSDGHLYLNELCFDNDTLASNELSTMKLTAEEQALINLWNTILDEAKATGKCNPNWKYGVYQITKEINSFTTIGTGKNKKIIYDYPKLNGDLNSLRVKLREYYKKYITPSMFKYELLK